MKWTWHVAPFAATFASPQSHHYLLHGLYEPANEGLYEDYILERWSQGCRNGAQIFREIQEKGFPGKISNVKAYIAHIRTSTKDGQAPQARRQRTEILSPREIRWLLTHKREKLDEEDQTKLDRLLQVSTVKYR